MEPLEGQLEPLVPASAHPVAARPWRAVFYSFAVLNLITVSLSFWLTWQVIHLNDPLIDAAALEKFEYAIAALALLVAGSILRGLQLGRQLEAGLDLHLRAEAG